MPGSCLGIFSSSQGPRSSLPVVTGTSVVTGVVVADGAAHPLCLLLKHCCHHEGLPVGVLTIANIPSHEPCFTAVNSCVQQLATANSNWGSGQGGIGWHLSAFPLGLGGWLLRAEVFLEGIKDVLMEALVGSLLTLASSR